MGYIYIIGCSKYRWFKIGKTARPNIRVKELGILLPFSVNIIGIWRVLDYHTVEKALHDAHKSKQINGEWFLFTNRYLRKLVAELNSAHFALPIPEDKVYRPTEKSVRQEQWKVLFLSARASHLSAHPDDSKGASAFAREILDKARNGQLQLVTSS